MLSLNHELKQWYIDHLDQYHGFTFVRSRKLILNTIAIRVRSPQYLNYIRTRYPCAWRKRNNKISSSSRLSSTHTKLYTPHWTHRIIYLYLIRGNKLCIMVITVISVHLKTRSITSRGIALVTIYYFYYIQKFKLVYIHFSGYIITCTIASSSSLKLFT